MAEFSYICKQLKCKISDFKTQLDLFNILKKKHGEEDAAEIIRIINLLIQENIKKNKQNAIVPEIKT